MNQINRFLKSEAATLMLLALALVAQAPHAATVFHRLAPPEEAASWLAWLHAAAYAIALELATLVFVVRGKQRLAWLFAVVSVAVNIAYYWTPDLALADGLRAALVSIALPVAIAFYSHDVARHSTDASTQANSIEAPVAIGVDKTTWIDDRAQPRPAEPATGQATDADAPEDAPPPPDLDASPAILPDLASLAVQAERKETGVERVARLASERAAQAEALHGLSVEDRRKELRKMRTNGHASTSKAELAALFDVAPSTITRDLQALGLQ